MWSPRGAGKRMPLHDQIVSNSCYKDKRFRFVTVRRHPGSCKIFHCRLRPAKWWEFVGPVVAARQRWPKCWPAISYLTPGRCISTIGRCRGVGTAAGARSCRRQLRLAARGHAGCVWRHRARFCRDLVAGLVPRRARRAEGQWHRTRDPRLVAGDRRGIAVAVRQDAGANGNHGCRRGT